MRSMVEGAWSLPSALLPPPPARSARPLPACGEDSPRIGALRQGGWQALLRCTISATGVDPPVQPRRTSDEPRGRRSSEAAALLGDPDPDGRAGDVVPRHRHRQCRLAVDRSGSPHQRRRFDLGRQRLSAGGHDRAATLRLVRRHLWLPPGLPFRPRALHRGGAGQRARDLARHADPGPCPAGARRRRGDERQHGSCALPIRAANWAAASPWCRSSWRCRRRPARASRRRSWR